MGSGYYPPVTEDLGQLEKQEIDTLNPGLLTLDNSRTTVDAEDCNDGSEGGNGHHDGAEKSLSIIFWSHDLVNVRYMSPSCERGLVRDPQSC